jgi:hypothetical protein
MIQYYVLQQQLLIAVALQQGLQYRVMYAYCRSMYSILLILIWNWRGQICQGNNDATCRKHATFFSLF